MKTLAARILIATLLLGCFGAVALAMDEPPSAAPEGVASPTEAATARLAGQWETSMNLSESRRERMLLTTILELAPDGRQRTITSIGAEVTADKEGTWRVAGVDESDIAVELIDPISGAATLHVTFDGDDTFELRGDGGTYVFERVTPPRDLRTYVPEPPPPVRVVPG